jgi:hypothetical protein
MANHSKLMAVAISFALFGIATPSSAQQARNHEGFYLRLGGGFTYLSDSIETDDLLLIREAKGTAKGGGGASELALGGAVAPGVILGGGFYSHWVPSLESDDAEIGNLEVGDIEFEESQLHVLGPFVDFYPNPSSGLHLQASLGLALGSLGEGQGNNFVIEENGGGGFGFVGGVGYEWWIADNWSLGILGRFTAAWFSAEDDNEVEWSHAVIAPAVLFTATMN